MIDEVYTAAKIEYQNGEFIGFDEDGKVSKTLLVFMVHSLQSKYKDVVKLVPIAKLNKAKLKKSFDLIMEELYKLELTVLAVSYK
jgi:hypothetical protein